MKTIKTTISLLSIILIATGCGSIGRSKVTVSNVTVTEITFNDLDQVMIFAENEENKPVIFVKDFYSRSKTREAVDQEIKNYLVSISKFRGKKASIKYYKNKHGDSVFQEINRLRKQYSRIAR